MNTESPRLRALMAAGAALVVFGITIPATASPENAPGRPADGTAGVANDKARPPGQSINNPGGDENNGFRCDDNGGAGQGNPALGSCDGGTVVVEEPRTKPTKPTKPGGDWVDPGS